MKKYHYFILIIILSLSVSCDESFSPVADFRERNILFSMINCDTTFQSVILSKSYKIEELEEYNDNEGKLIENADVKIWYRGEVFQFRDTVLSAASNTGLKYHAYVNKELKPEPDEFLDIEALLPNGLLLRSSTKTPLNYSFYTTSTDMNVPSTKHPSYLFFEWEYETNVYYIPKLFVEYYKYSPGKATLLTKELPVDYLSNGVETSPYFAEPSQRNSISISMHIVEAGLKELSAGDPKKDNYRIMEIYFELFSMDRNLSAYIAATKNFSTDFTVKLDSPDYTNIDGGFGVFGSFSKKSLFLYYDRDYIESLGYLITY